MKRFVFFLGLLFLTAGATQAATITFTLVINDNGSGSPTVGSYAVYADDSLGDNAGLATFAVALMNTTSIVNQAPRTVYDPDGSATTTVPAGFTLFHNSVSPVTGFQDTPDAIADPSSVVLIYGFGQTSDDFASHNPFPGGTQDTPRTQISWNAHLKLITGTYNTSGPLPAFDPVNPSTATVFTTNGGTTQTDATVQLNTTTLVPEPSVGAGILLLALAGCARRRTI